MAKAEIPSLRMNNAWYISSTGDGLSLTIKGLSLAGFEPVISLVVAVINAVFKTNLTDTTGVQFAQLGVFAVSFVMIVAGLVRKAVIAFSKKTA